jgi:hypothetical protein
MNEHLRKHFGFDELKTAVQATTKYSNEVSGVSNLVELKDSISYNESDNDAVASLELNMQALSINDANGFSTVSADLLLYRPRKHGKDLADCLSKMSLLSKSKRKRSIKNRRALNKKKNNRKFRQSHDRIT